MQQAVVTAVVLLCLSSLSAAMKLHDSINTSIGTGSNVCRSSKDSLKILANDLEESLGYNAMLYKGCLQFVKNNAHLDLPIMAQIEAHI